MTCLLQYTVTATPVNGGPPVTLTVSSPSATLSGLLPGSQYRVTATGKLANGQNSAASPAVIMTMPATGWGPLGFTCEPACMGNLRNVSAAEMGHC